LLRAAARTIADRRSFRLRAWRDWFHGWRGHLSRLGLRGPFDDVDRDLSLRFGLDRRRSLLHGFLGHGSDFGGRRCVDGRFRRALARCTGPWRRLRDVRLLAYHVSCLVLGHHESPSTVCAHAAHAVREIPD
jgi:hypothetical protein